MQQGKHQGKIAVAQSPVTPNSTYSNITTLADYLLTLFQDDLKQESDRQNNLIDDNVTQLAAMSEAEAEALLLEELKDFNLFD